ncbi:isoprenyl transferase [Temperatibacter marinus]|uniref:Isoprenyl transferase n=1 Tax=Temperatibacter marinus TaxID=1456591 RepID=A0AA52EHF8_9PROT|nr:isoprenyl transferase [Temperatibacter marinus]WND02384.1 isoprenyl transferase [Temperatibacter marinus]
MNISADSLTTDCAQERNGPQHIAIIMDGNGRWAEERGLPRVEGHRRGAKAVRNAIEGAVKCGVGYLTIYAFSTENWNRSSAEVSDLMGLLRFYLQNEIKTLHKEKIRLKIIGDRSRLDADIQKMITTAEDKTADNERMTLIIALNYGARDELVNAFKIIAGSIEAGRLKSSDVTEQLITDHLYTARLPDPDMVIRTSGEKRVSNFLLWQIAYSELLFLDVFWPDFSEDHIQQAVNEYMSRNRRFGGRPGK